MAEGDECSSPAASSGAHHPWRVKAFGSLALHDASYNDDDDEEEEEEEEDGLEMVRRWARHDGDEEARKRPNGDYDGGDYDAEIGRMIIGDIGDDDEEEDMDSIWSRHHGRLVVEGDAGIPHGSPTTSLISSSKGAAISKISSPIYSIPEYHGAASSGARVRPICHARNEKGSVAGEEFYPRGSQSAPIRVEKDDVRSSMTPQWSASNRGKK